MTVVAILTHAIGAHDLRDAQVCAAVNRAYTLAASTFKHDFSKFPNFLDVPKRCKNKGFQNTDDVFEVRRPVDHGRPWSTLADHGRPWSTKVDLGLPRLTLADIGRPWSVVVDLCRPRSTSVDSTGLAVQT